MTRTCAHPGCDRGISDRSTSGVCRQHNHGRACACPPCQRRRGVAEVLTVAAKPAPADLPVVPPAAARPPVVEDWRGEHLIRARRLEGDGLKLARRAAWSVNTKREKGLL